MIRLDLTYAEIMLLYFYIKSTMGFFEWNNANKLLRYKNIKKK